jgi:disulfide bond formation protein DsbB
MPLLFKQLNALGLLAVSIVMMFALYAQIVEHELPCPLCLIQRLGFAGVMLGLLLNALYSPKPKFYTLSTIFAVFGAAAALRQISLHVIPGTPFYGDAFLGFHFYTWAFICFSLIITGLSIISGFAKQYQQNLGQKRLAFKQQPMFIKISVVLAIVILLLNTIITFAQCGPDVCTDDPTIYWLLK